MLMTNKIMAYMAYRINLSIDRGQVFESIFLEYLQAISKISAISADVSIDRYVSLNKNLCELCDKIADKVVFVDQLLSIWLQYLRTMSDHTKNSVFQHLTLDSL